MRPDARPLRGEQIQADQAIRHVLDGECRKDQSQHPGHDVDACLAEEVREPSRSTKEQVGGKENHGRRCEVRSADTGSVAGNAASGSSRVRAGSASGGTS